MERKTFVVRHPSQLNTLSTLPLFRTAGVGKIVFHDSFQHENKKKWEGELNRHYYACGCSQGAKALLIGLVVFGITGLLGQANYDWSLANTVITILGGAVGMAIVGKLGALINSNSKLKHVIKEVQAVWKPRWPQSTIVGCG